MPHEACKEGSIDGGHAHGLWYYPVLYFGHLSHSMCGLAAQHFGFCNFVTSLAGATCSPSLWNNFHFRAGHTVCTWRRPIHPLLSPVPVNDKEERESG